MSIEIKLTERTKWSFDKAECIVYIDGNGNYWFKFLSGYPEQTIKGPYPNYDEALKAASLFYKNEWVPF